jgi:hypothetical protein
VEKLGAGSASRQPISAMSTTDAEWGEHIGEASTAARGIRRPRLTFHSGGETA